MSDPLGVSPDSLRATADYLADTSDGMKKAVASLRETLAAGGAAWGDDKMGKQFADIGWSSVHDALDACR